MAELLKFHFLLKQMQYHFLVEDPKFFPYLASSLTFWIMKTLTFLCPSCAIMDTKVVFLIILHFSTVYMFVIVYSLKWYTLIFIGLIKHLTNSYYDISYGKYFINFCEKQFHLMRRNVSIYSYVVSNIKIKWTFSLFLNMCNVQLFWIGPISSL